MKNKNNKNVTNKKASNKANQNVTSKQQNSNMNIGFNDDKSFHLDEDNDHSFEVRDCK